MLSLNQFDIYTYRALLRMGQYFNPGELLDKQIIKSYRRSDNDILVGHGCNLDVDTLPDTWQEHEGLLHKYFEGNTKASPLKIAGCVAEAFSLIQPVSRIREKKILLDHPVMHRLPLANSEIEDQTELVFAQEQLRINAWVGIEVALELIMHSRFDEAPDIQPPYDLGWPSVHFVRDLIRGMISDLIHAPAIALILELRLYADKSGKGGQIKNSIDEQKLPGFCHP